MLQTSGSSIDARFLSADGQGGSGGDDPGGKAPDKPSQAARVGPSQPAAPSVRAQVSGSHVNSGPTQHSNTAGHANFSKTVDPAIRIQENVLPEFLQPGKGSSHVNSGPTHHSNTNGHANFSKVKDGIRVLPPELSGKGGPTTR